MNHYEETGFLWESWNPRGKRKTKKGPHRDKICSKRKNIITMNTSESIQKKKKKTKAKFKETTEGRKEKKKNKNKLSLGLVAADPVAKSEHDASYPGSSDRLTEDSKKKTKRKKKVAFDLSPGYIRVKRPKLAPSSTKQNTLQETEAVRDTSSCSQVIVTGQSQAQPLENDSQCTGSDDINSQDLFITQKIFRSLPSQPSSGEASDKADTTLQTSTQQEMVEPSSVVQIQHLEELNTHLQGSRIHEHIKMMKEHLLKPKAVQIFTEEEEEDFHLAEQNSKTQMKLNSNLTEKKPVSVKPRVVNPYLDEPIVVNCSMNVAKPKQLSRTVSKYSPTCLLNTDRPSLLPCMPTATVATQTENFFTSKFSSYFNFCQKSRATVCFENLKPLDLSLPQRTRKNWEKCIMGELRMSETEVNEEKFSERKQSLPEKMTTNGQKDPNLRASCSTDTKVALQKEPAVRQLWDVSAKGKSKITPSPPSEPEPKSAETTSSEDNEPPCRTGKVDLTQVRAVQMRLNESFFFKTKGEQQSPRPESPLMKLVQSRDMKSRKGY